MLIQTNGLIHEESSIDINDLTCENTKIYDQ